MIGGPVREGHGEKKGQSFSQTLAAQTAVQNELCAIPPLPQAIQFQNSPHSYVALNSGEFQKPKMYNLKNSLSGNVREEDFRKFCMFPIALFPCFRKPSVI